MTKNGRLGLAIPPLEERRRCVAKLKGEVRELSHARTLTQVAKSLVCLHEAITNTAGLHGIDIAPLLKMPHSIRALQSELQKQTGGKDSAIINLPMPGRARVKKLIMDYAMQKAFFTVDDLMKDMAKLGVTRRSLSANLWSMATRGVRPLQREEEGKKGRRGAPAVYSLRRIADNKAA